MRHVAPLYPTARLSPRTDRITCRRQSGRALQLLRSAFASCLVAIGLAVALAGAAQAACAKVNSTRPGEVYLLRGLANIFSLGLDEMGKQFTSYGMENCVFNHSVWQSLANDILERSYRGAVNYPVIIIGHSLGAGAAPQLATTLGKHGVPTAYVVMFDPVEPTRAGANVQEIINFYLPKRNDNLVRPTGDFTGKLSNVNLARFGGFTHLNIDYNKDLRQIVYRRTLELSQARTDAAANEK